LPNGLILTLSSAGDLYGTPKNAGDFRFAVRAYYKTEKDEKFFTIKIAKGTGASLSGSLTMESITHNRITVNAVTPPSNNQSVEYAISKVTMAPGTGWQDEPIFSGLTSGETYYLFARAKGNENYDAGAAIMSSPVSTDQQTGVGDVEMAASMQAWIQNDMLHVTGLTAGETLSVYNITGVLIYNNSVNADEVDIPLYIQGVYLLRHEKHTIKVVFRK